MPVLAKKQIKNNGIETGLLEQRAKALEAVASKNAQEVRPADADEAKETNITFRLTEKEKAEYKTFFDTQNVSLSFGIKLAIEHMILDVKAGKGTIKKTGYFEH